MIGDSKYVSITTYRRDGGSTSVPVWIAPLDDGIVGFTTGSDSVKAKRIGNDPRVELRPCDMRGNVADGAATVTGTAEVVTGDEFEAVREAVKAKYRVAYVFIGMWASIAKLFGRGASSDCAIVITLD